MDCKERNFELIVEITAYPDSAVTFTDPMQVRKKFLTSEDYTLDESQAMSIPLKAKTAKLQESEKRELMGDVYTVNLTWEVDKLSQEGYETYENLRKSFKHLKIKTFGDNCSIVRSNEDGYQFVYEEDGGVIKASLSVMNLSGIQRVI